MLKKVYIETTIPSFYYEIRTEPEMLARREWTIEWWDNRRQNYFVVTSEAVLEELGNGVYPNKQDSLSLIKDVPLLKIELPILEIVENYIKHKLMPNDPLGDALHLALASYHKCDFLLTWNCNHLANANKFNHIQRVNTLLGLFVPMIITPLELLGEQYA
jgi:predicted nucleic acid-binding protein